MPACDTNITPFNADRLIWNGDQRQPNRTPLNSLSKYSVGPTITCFKL
ncbi:hypothetical protein PRUPE_1G305800 [Prunus persica]|uniref:Uncharacterized protein n=1 Tax=Prunus persica TaxID=3760 RepID=A0A251R5K1_PRUPE|nr:hypothetical protein PRUPE_1G305800 [Prunus persica]